MNLVDELGELEEQLAPFQTKIKRVETLRKELRDWAEQDGVPAPEACTYHGRLYTAEVTARGFQQRITSISRVFKLLTPARFLKLCTITLAAIQEHLTAEQYAEVVVQEQTGPRKVRTFRRLPPAQVKRSAA